MKTALVGFTGFVGNNLNVQNKFTHLYNSKNISEIKGNHFDLLVFSAARAEKWKANQNPEADHLHILDLVHHLDGITADQAVLISTVDVYNHSEKVNEDSPTEIEGLHPYGLNRLHLEKHFAKKFKNYLILRLPALFGSGIKKNIIYDFINHNQIEKIDSRGIFQFYNLDNIWSDLNRCLKANAKLVNLVTEPVSAAEIYENSFGTTFKNEILPIAPRYDIHTKFAALWNRTGNYIESKEVVLTNTKTFIRSESNLK